MQHRRIFYLISALIIVPGILSLLVHGLKLSIDFTGGSVLELANIDKLNQKELETEISKHANVISIQETGKNAYLIRTEPIEQKVNTVILEDLRKKDSDVKEVSFDTVGPTIGAEMARKAFFAVLIASAAITLYIAYAFREVSKPLSSWKYGVAAVSALLHDVLFLVGLFSILGWLFHVEIDALFITALLTIMGFSVHDSIVVFDRVRENLKRELPLPFDEVVNVSLMETFNRSLNTTISTVLVIFTLLLFSEGAMRWFLFALFVGILSGTYSSLFNASPLLVTWNNWDERKKKKAKK